MMKQRSWIHTVLAALFMGLFALGCGTAPERNEVQPAPQRTQTQPSAATSGAYAGEPTRRVRGQTLYVPCYSHIYFRDAERTINLATTLSIRNISPTDTLSISQVSYYDSDGELVRHYLQSPRTLGPLVSTYFVVREEDLHGGVGANFIVTWTANTPVHPPMVEAVHVTTRMQLGISFTSPSRVLNEEP